MLNQDLINMSDPKDRRIAQLEHTIQSFKNFDANRTKQMNNIIQKNAANEEYIKELEEQLHALPEADYILRIRQLEEKNRRLKKAYKTQGFLGQSEYSENEELLMNDILSLKELKEENQKLKDSIVKLKKNRDELLARLKK